MPKQAVLDVEIGIPPVGELTLAIVLVRPDGSMRQVQAGVRRCDWDEATVNSWCDRWLNPAVIALRQD